MQMKMIHSSILLRFFMTEWKSGALQFDSYTE